jgi:outer membrane lipoprotein-sorting protein
MNNRAAISAGGVAGMIAATLMALSVPAGGATPPPSPSPAQRALAKFDAAWNALKTYSCTLDAHEVQDRNVQDRTYDLWFSKPFDTRMNITGGAGHGGAAVWHGGDKVSGHQGGIISFIHLTLNIHDGRATSLRGITIAEANFGAYLDKIHNAKFKSIEALPDGDKWTITLVPADPATFQNITKETIVLGASGLPTDITMYIGEGVLAVHNVYKDTKINVAIPPSTFNL